MKTKNLMTAFALSAMFAACTQDAELNETLAKNDFSNIPMVEAEFTADFGVESRMATKFGFEVGDKVGLAWLGTGDILTGNTTGMAYQNHPLFCTNAAKKSFKTETMLYVGKYFAYLPYTQGNMAVENIAFSIAEQPLTTNANDLAKQAIYLSTETTILEKANDKGEVTDGAQKAGMGNNVKLNLALLNNPATIKFAFKNIDALTGLEITNVKVEMLNAAGNNSIASIAGFLHNGNLQDWTESTAAEFFHTNSTFTRGAVNLKGELAVSGNELTTYALLLPTEIPAQYVKLNITLTTNYGTVVAENVKVDNAKLFTNFGVAATVTADVDGKNIVKSEAEVKTQAELNDVLNKLVASAQEEDVEITLNPAEKNDKETFILTDFYLPEGLKNNITLTTGDNATKGIVFAGNTNINYPISVASPASIEGTMTVSYIKNKTTYNGYDLVVNNDAVLINNGKIDAYVKTVAADEDEELGFGKYVNNGEHAEMVNPLNNLGEAQWIAGKLPARVAETNAIYAEATDLAGIEAANKAKVTLVRLIDGAWIGNNTEAIKYNDIYTVECYGNVNFYVTDTPRGAANAFGFDYANIVVKENASLTVNSDNKDNILAVKSTITVEENASLNITGIRCAAEVNNAGSVSINNVIGIEKGTQAEGSSWLYNEAN